MDEKKRDTGTDEQYEETTNPHNPPESVVGPEERTEWFLSSVGTLAVIFVIVAAAFGWVYVRHELGSQSQNYPDPQATGTSGEQQLHDGTRGFNPVEGTFRTTKEELKFRGTTGPAPGTAGPAPGPTDSTALELTKIGELKKAPIGARVAVANVTVARTDGNFVWVKDGAGDTFVVAVPGDTPTVNTGQHVDITGTIESNGASTWLRASRIDVK